MTDSPTPAAPSAAPRPPATRAGRRLSPRQRFMLVAFGLLVPVIILGLAEGGLRIAGFGGYPGVLQKVGPLPGQEQATLWISDPAGAASYFFNNQNRPGSLNQTTFVDPKPPGTFRVFALGESAMQGFPQPAGFAATEFLSAMLADAWPDRRVEVINLGVTAVASFPVAAIADEALGHQPDLLVVYVGNNEFFGAYGVASLNRAAASPAMMQVQRWFNGLAFVQGVRAGLRKLQPPRDQTLMETMMGQSYTGPEDPLRDRAARNLRTHLDRIIAHGRQAGVPVVVCTLPSNERDLAPLGESDLSALSSTDRERVKELIRRGRAGEQRDPTAAIDALEEAVKLAPQHATAFFHLGRALLNAGRGADGLAALERAMALDPMPWRPPPASNQAVRDAVAASGGAAVLADLQAAFRAASPQGATGWELMDDHVHPTLAGQHLVAQTILKAMAGLSGAAKVPPEAAAQGSGFADYATRLGANPYDAYGVDHTMRVLALIPFIEATNPGMKDRFQQRCEVFERAQPREVLDVARDWQQGKSHIGGKRPLSGMAARALLRMERSPDAEPLFKVAARHVLAYSAWNLEFTYFYLVCHERSQGRLDDEDLAMAGDAIERGRLLIAQKRSTTGQVERFMARLHQLRGEHEQAVPLLNVARRLLTSTDLVAADQALVESLLKLGRSAEAREVVNNGIRLSGQYADLYRRMERMLPKGP